MYKFVFRIRKRYFDQIVAGTKTIEYRRDTSFWHTRIINLFYKLNFGFYPVANPNVLFTGPIISDAEAIFICGKQKKSSLLSSIAIGSAKTKQ
jgi:hypothetical protein